MKIWKKCRVPVGRSGADPTGVGLMNLLYTGRSNRNVTVKVLMNDTHCDKVTMLFYYVTIKRFSLIIMIFHLVFFFTNF